MKRLSVLCVNISIPGYSTKNNYDQALETLYALPPQDSFEVFLIDNGSVDDSVEFFTKKWGKKVEVVDMKKNFGYHFPQNRVVERSEGEYLYFHNPDIRLGAGDLDKMMDYMDKHPDIAALAPQLRNPDGSIQDDSFRRFMRPLDFIIKRLKPLHKFSWFKKRMTRFLMWGIDVSKIQDIEWAITGGTMMRKSHFEEVGGFDERYFLFVGDMDICRKFIVAGHRNVYFPEVQIQHGDQRLSGNGFWQSLFKKTAWIHLSDLVKYFVKWRMK